MSQNYEYSSFNSYLFEEILVIADQVGKMPHRPEFLELFDHWKQLTLADVDPDEHHRVINLRLARNWVQKSDFEAAAAILEDLCMTPSPHAAQYCLLFRLWRRLNKVDYKAGRCTLVRRRVLAMEQMDNQMVEALSRYEVESSELQNVGQQFDHYRNIRPCDYKMLVMAWDDVSAIYENGTASTSDRTITSSSLDFTLGWGGMALDKNSQYLYLVSTDGVVARIRNVSTQNGALTSTSDIITFTLDDTGTDAAGSGVYGQAAVNSAGSLLFVTEANASNSKSQIWVIPTSAMTNGTTLTESNVTLIGNTTVSGGVSDKACTGVSASSNKVFAYFNKGGSISPNSTGTYTASRLRMGTSSGFSATSVVSQ
jgi:hypothetical protein